MMDKVITRYGVVLQDLPASHNVRACAFLATDGQSVCSPMFSFHFVTLEEAIKLISPPKMKLQLTVLIMRIKLVFHSLSHV